MGSDVFYAEERPSRMETVGAFQIDLFPVTNDQFAGFVTATQYVTSAEKAGGSFVFRPPSEPVDLKGPPIWWRSTDGAAWNHPQGPNSSIGGLGSHPVVHVTQDDARAYADWCGKRLPSEAEWECAARGGLADAVYAWGDAFRPDGRYMANTWQGEFPIQDLGEDGYKGTSPVGSFPPNGYGIYDMIGNVWEWTATMAAIPPAVSCGCFSPEERSRNTVLKGGSHLCAQNYCKRYRPAARIFQAPLMSTNHIGFRCVHG